MNHRYNQNHYVPAQQQQPQWQVLEEKFIFDQNSQRYLKQLLLENQYGERVHDYLEPTQQELHYIFQQEQMQQQQQQYQNPLQNNTHIAGLGAGSQNVSNNTNYSNAYRPSYENRMHGFPEEKAKLVREEYGTTFDLDHGTVPKQFESREQWWAFLYSTAVKRAENKAIARGEQPPVINHSGNNDTTQSHAKATITNGAIQNPFRNQDRWTKEFLFDHIKLERNKLTDYLASIIMESYHNNKKDMPETLKKYIGNNPIHPIFLEYFVPNLFIVANLMSTKHIPCDFDVDKVGSKEERTARAVAWGYFNNCFEHFCHVMETYLTNKPADDIVKRYRDFRDRGLEYYGIKKYIEVLDSDFYLYALEVAKDLPYFMNANGDFTNYHNRDTRKINIPVGKGPIDKSQPQYVHDYADSKDLPALPQGTWMYQNGVYDADKPMRFQQPIKTQREVKQESLITKINDFNLPREAVEKDLFDAGFSLKVENDLYIFTGDNSETKVIFKEEPKGYNPNIPLTQKPLEYKSIEQSNAQPLDGDDGEVIRVNADANVFEEEMTEDELWGEEVEEEDMEDLEDGEDVVEEPEEDLIDFSDRIQVDVSNYIQPVPVKQDPNDQYLYTKEEFIAEMGEKEWGAYPKDKLHCFVVRTIEGKLAQVFLRKDKETEHMDYTVHVNKHRVVETELPKPIKKEVQLQQLSDLSLEENTFVVLDEEANQSLNTKMPDDSVNGVLASMTVCADDGNVFGVANNSKLIGSTVSLLDDLKVLKSSDLNQAHEYLTNLKASKEKRIFVAEMNKIYTTFINDILINQLRFDLTQLAYSPDFLENYPDLLDALESFTYLSKFKALVSLGIEKLFKFESLIREDNEDNHYLYRLSVPVAVMVTQESFEEMFSDETERSVYSFFSFHPNIQKAFDEAMKVSNYLYVRSSDGELYAVNRKGINEKATFNLTRVYRQSNFIYQSVWV